MQSNKHKSNNDTDDTDDNDDDDDDTNDDFTLVLLYNLYCNIFICWGPTFLTQ